MKIEIDISTDNAAFWLEDGEPCHEETRDILNEAVQKLYSTDFAENPGTVLVDSNGNSCGHIRIKT